MNCQKFRKQYVDLLDAESDVSGQNELSAHVESCPSCAEFYGEIDRTVSTLAPSRAVSASPHFKERVMSRVATIDQSDRQPTRPWSAVLTRAWKPALVATGAVLLLGILSIVNSGRRQGGLPSVAAITLLAQAAEAVAELDSVHIQARMRTVDHDNFELIRLDRDFVPIEMWKQFGPPQKWRVEKPKRVVVMDGKSSMQLIRSGIGVLASKGGPGKGYINWLKPLLDPHRVLENEKRQARTRGWQLGLEEQEGQDGKPKHVLTVEAKAQGDFANDWLKNKSIAGSDNRRVYTFDAETHRLEGLLVYVHNGEEDVLVFEITQIEYDVDLDPELFSLTLHEDAVWFEDPKTLPDNEKYQNMSPEETARLFFQACADEDWDEMLKFWGMSAATPQMKKWLGGLEIVSIGKPFKSGRYPGWFVPYEIKFRSGETKKFNLAMRNDNRAKRWVVDGGL